LLLEFALGWLGGGWAARWGQSLVTEVLASGFSRAQEREADATACELLEKAGFSSLGLASLLEDLAAGAAPGGILGSHPAPQERAAWIRKRGFQAHGSQLRAHSSEALSPEP